MEEIHSQKDSIIHDSSSGKDLNYRLLKDIKKNSKIYTLSFNAIYLRGQLLKKVLSYLRIILQPNTNSQETQQC